MRKPIIGIPAKQETQRENDLFHRLDLVDELRIQVLKQGGIAIMLTPSEITLDFNQSDLGDDTILSPQQIADLKQQVDLCDGIILQGGDFSCEYEVEIARYALHKNIPILGICAGFNNILRALGSNIYEDTTLSHASNSLTYRHPVAIKEGTLLHEIIENTDYQVNSLHTMIADEKDVAPYACINAYSPDGLVECFNVPDKKFALAVKWHPELMGEDRGAQRIFEYLLNACR